MSDAPDIPPVPPPGGMTPQEVKNWGMLCHLSSLLGYVLIPLGNIIFPLIIWSIYKDKDPFIDANGKESLNFQL